jgi:transcriptional regulator with XRE-family HTH domain
VKQSFAIFKNIKKARVFSELSQKQLAKKLGVSDKTVSAYETGRAFPPTPTLVKIAEITKVPISEIMGVEDNRNKNTNNDKISETLDKLEKRVSNIERAIIKLVK